LISDFVVIIVRPFYVYYENLTMRHLYDKNRLIAIPKTVFDIFREIN